jgi:hypothetical protein
LFYTIYKITNRVNGKYYIGKHQTEDLNDGYFGSGKLLKRAIAKHGKDNFTKEILFVFDTESEMNAKEAELVVVSEDTYNLCNGGNGGWGYINSASFQDQNKEKLKEIRKRGRVAADLALEKKYGPNWRSIISNMSTGSQVFKEKYQNDAAFKDTILAASAKGLVAAQSTAARKKRIDSLRAICHNQGEKNPNFGKIWVNNGSTNKMIKKVDKLPDGWYKGKVKLLT